MAKFQISTNRATVDIPQGRISYFRHGEGPPLVLLHSLALSADMWLPVIEDFARHFEVIALDLRGHGMSTYDGNDFSVEDMADDLKQFFDALNLAKVHLLGMSMGGCVAISFASRYPEYVDRLVLCDTTAYYGDDAVQAWKGRALTALSKPRILQIPFQTDRWFCDRFRRTNPEIVAHVVDIFLRTKPQVHAQASYALGSFDNRSKLSDIVSPTLAMTGDEDGATPPPMGELLGREIPNASFRLCRGLRHFAVVESPSVRSAAINHLLGFDATLNEIVDATPCCEAFGAYSDTNYQEKKS